MTACPMMRYFGAWAKLDESLDLDLSDYVDFDTYNQNTADLVATDQCQGLMKPPLMGR